jgi:hypothetical protein
MAAMFRLIKWPLIFLATGVVLVLLIARWNQSSKFISDNVGNAVAGACGALFGAMTGYWFQRWKEAKDREESHYSAVLRAQMALISHLEATENLRRQLEPFKEIEGRAFKIPIIWSAAETVTIDYSGLAFLLNLKYPDVIQLLARAQRAYLDLVHSMGVRNEWVEKYAATTILEEYNSKTGRFRAKGSPRETFMLANVTDLLFENLDNAAAKNEAAFALLRETAKKIFPGKMLFGTEAVL